MTRKTLRNIIWAIAGVYAVLCILCGAFHHLFIAGFIFLLGWIQEDIEEEDRYEL